MEPLFKVGDIVRVKERTKYKGDYKFVFSDKMSLQSGKVFTILTVKDNFRTDSYAVPDDNALYRLKDDPTQSNWSSGMLELVSGETYVTPSNLDKDTFKITLTKKNKLKLNFKL